MTLERHFSEQAADATLDAPGSPHFAYYWRPLQLSFLWNGWAEAIDVCHGGYGEPVVMRIPAIVTWGGPLECLGAFREQCDTWMKDSSNWNLMVEVGIAGAAEELPDIIPR